MPDFSYPETGPADLPDRRVALVDLLDRLLVGGAVLTGDVVLSIADVELVHIDLRAVIRSLGPDTPGPW
ncbi:gas vesicle protein [Streptomyces sp. KK5PA1]|uniref:Gas vesicle protein n=1 Tax=Actinacidiphila acididurans TaxID=2784346 RepID=A0ABS2TSN0_9ACTN|nr:gas vesicle protein [Actinacidiphila acididurans]MBM9506329.1 gas vesicle protein [Actinacidiphila acididurans]